jgi:hypothetical protein
MDASRQLVVVPDREPLTEAEARRIGHSATRIAQLRDLHKQVQSGSISIQTANGAMSLALTKLDLEAALGLLIEREAQFLSSFNVEVDKA